ncbi:hypothetical protein MMC34_008602, partial [Xylographa carneopallida]|nr:hypothetical protein [Xylographa carneopallida]
LMAQVGPTAEEKAAVVGWLKANGVEASAIADHGDLLNVVSSVGQVESLFGTTLHYHVNTLTGQKGTVSAGDVTLPADLPVNHIHGVYSYPHQLMHVGTQRASAQPQVAPAPGHDMQTQSVSSHAMHTMQLTAEVNRACSGSFGYYPLVGPQFLATAYNFSLRNTYTTRSNTSALVTAFGTQAFYQPDLTHQQGNIGFSASFAKPTVYNAAGNNYQLGSVGIGVEADLDIQALYQIAPTSNNSFYGTNSAGSQSLLQTLTAIAALPGKYRPQVVSISYGFGASDYNYLYSSDGAATESKLQQLGTLGVTVIASAGDDGANGGYNGQCSAAPNSLGYGTISPIATTTFLPTYPAASRYVLSVAETDFLGSATSPNAAFGAFSPSVNTPPECDNCPSDQSPNGFLCQATNLGEEVVSIGNRNNITGQTSGGGISSVFPLSSWQKTAQAAYFATKCAASSGCVLPPAGYYNASNRGYPDVALFGGQIGISYYEQETVVGGTSVSAPLFAGLIARLNEVNLARKGASLGLVAPLFYAMAAAQPNTFHDITTGENTCPQGNGNCGNVIQTGHGTTTCKGWRGAQGWDPVTGLGSPNVGQILTYLSKH